ncbi:hypothetical protein AVEN_255932-1, partial [Araneus ventricosus]
VHIHGRSSVESDFRTGTLRLRRRDLTISLRGPEKQNRDEHTLERTNNMLIDPSVTTTSVPYELQHRVKQTGD